LTSYVKVAFFGGRSHNSATVTAATSSCPARCQQGTETRYRDIREDDELDEAQLASWLK
jgi:hypothetical protein